MSEETEITEPGTAPRRRTSVLRMKALANAARILDHTKTIPPPVQPSLLPPPHPRRK
jgi:hypothetical protein